jgi:hypothetical protein
MQEPSFRKRMKRIFLNETGQMTVFVALIFQVLFVFFAMVINIGLLVHDKINLQNAVDLGAYYGAQRQAEILNEIAHINYQIHQDNKLLAWRYHVLGTLGRDGGTEGNTAATRPGRIYGPDEQEREFPSVCVANSYWKEATLTSPNLENYCYQQYGPRGRITKIPPLIIIAPFVPGVVSGAIQIGQLRDAQDLALQDQGPLNWAFAAQMMEAYKMSLTSRKTVIQKLRQNLVSGNMTDQGQEPVATGVLATIKNNLTMSNYSSFLDDGFGFKNGLASPDCAGSSNDGSPTIKEIRTSPVMLYTYSYLSGAGSYEVQQTYETDTAPIAGKIAPYDPGGFLKYFSGGEPSDTIGNDSVQGLNASSLGFEKNPWCMAYVGVHAKTSPRKPFAPFGESVVLEARAFAQPFGGRVGPWYHSQWPQASEVSAGGTRTDPLSTPRYINGASDGETADGHLPNYSRFPGDTLGIKSLAAQAATRKLVSVYNQKPTRQLSYSFYVGFDKLPIHGDPLAWDSTSSDQTKPSNLVLNIRNAESLAVSPDLFDVTYYSIDPYYATNYKALNNNDLGGRNGSDLQDFGIAKQIENANSTNGNGLDPGLRSSGVLNYFIFEVAHILTAWAPNSVSNFEFPSERFAKCAHMAIDAKHMIPGGCTNGGRTGYSVRILSRDHLLSPKWNVGGEGQVGPIKNPPPLDF